MLPYVLLIIVPVILQHLSPRRDTLIFTTRIIRSDRLMKLFWVMLIALLILRHESVGVDLLTYERIYNFIARSDWATAMGRSQEVAWSFLNKVISEMGGNYRWVVIVASLAGTVFIFKAYVKYSEDAALTISLFINTSIFALLFSGLRQCIAISLGFLAFELVKKKRIVLFLAVVVLACLFHTSAFMLLFMYPLYYVRLNRKCLIWIIPLMLFVFVYNQPIFSFLGVILNTFSDYDTEIILTGSYTMLVLLIIFAVYSYLIPDESLMDKDTVGMRNYLLLAVALQMFAPLHTVAMRMNYYYIIFLPLLIPKINKYRSKTWSQVAIAARHIMLIFFIAYFFITAPSDNLLNIFPYSFLWETVR